MHRAGVRLRGRTRHITLQHTALFHFGIAFSLVLLDMFSGVEMLVDIFLSLTRCRNDIIRGLVLHKTGEVS